VKFLADECCDAALVDAMRGDGHDVKFLEIHVSCCPIT